MRKFLLLSIVILISLLSFSATLTPILAEEGSLRFVYFEELLFESLPEGDTLFPAQVWSYSEDILPISGFVGVDGDTIKGYVDGKKTTIRLIGVDTPETVHPFKPVEWYGKEASTFTKTIASMDKLMVVTYDPINSRPDKYGRVLGYVWFYLEDEDSGIKHWYMLNLVLIINGYGSSYMTYHFREDYEELFVASNIYAKTAVLGLWVTH